MVLSHQPMLRSMSSCNAANCITLEVRSCRGPYLIMALKWLGTVALRRQGLRESACRVLLRLQCLVKPGNPTAVPVFAQLQQRLELRRQLLLLADACLSCIMRLCGNSSTHIAA